ncbi:MAG: DivIVA domain-containing protein [Desulfuromonadales bacterium]|nr:MAG: DivIVA domain-containing protein [Desulfuromonadales bacterium]
MKITPLDIQQQQFKGKMLGGLDPEDVDTFLQIVAQEMESLIRENTELKEQGKKAAADMEQMAQQEKNLREAMLAAQKITEEMKANAQKEATLIISEAEVKAEKLLADGERRLAQLNDQIQEMRRQRLQFESAFKSLLDTHYKMLSLDDQ